MSDEKCKFDAWYYDGFSYGRFLTTLFDAFIYADGDNRKKIVAAFPDEFKNSAFLKELGLL